MARAAGAKYAAAGVARTVASDVGVARGGTLPNFLREDSSSFCMESFEDASLGTIPSPNGVPGPPAHVWLSDV